MLHSNQLATKSIAEICVPPGELHADFVPSKFDVLCGKGQPFRKHVGNVRLKVQIDINLKRYQKSQTKAEKTMIVSEIVDAARSFHPDSGGRRGGFLRRLPSGKWFEIGDRAARDKVGHMIRETICPRSTRREAKETVRRKQRANSSPGRLLLRDSTQEQTTTTTTTTQLLSQPTEPANQTGRSRSDSHLSLNGGHHHHLQHEPLPAFVNRQWRSLDDTAIDSRVEFVPLEDFGNEWVEWCSEFAFD